MSTLRRIGWMLSRLVALAVGLASVWLLIVNLVEVSYEGWVLALILLSGLAGTVGAAVYLLSIDGPARYRTRALRILGWTAMLVAMLLPTSLSLFLLPLMLLLTLTLFSDIGINAVTSE